MLHRPQLTLSLERVLKCPRCKRSIFGLNAELITLKCIHCASRYWWAVRLDAGSVRDQVSTMFGDEASMLGLLDALGAPESIDQMVYWQIRLSGPEYYFFISPSVHGTMRERTRKFFRGLRDDGAYTRLLREVP